MDTTAFIDQYLSQTKTIADEVDRVKIAQAVELLTALKSRQGRLFILGVGGSAANASHAVNDFRKICGIESYAPTDNVSELTAWANDNGFETIFINWLKTSRVGPLDVLFIFSVGGGSQTTSRNLVLAMEHGRQVGAKILSIVSRDGGTAKKLSDVCLLVPVLTAENITPHAEGWQAVLWHLIANAVKARCGCVS
ncbi:MAG: SIS domain-containing protein [Candidatus Omnitrophota bacterium]